MNKVFIVECDISKYQTRSMVIVAESAEEAKKIAREEWDLSSDVKLNINFEINTNWKGYITSFVE